jgi:hypothetical protein
LFTPALTRSKKKEAACDCIQHEPCEEELNADPAKDGSPDDRRAGTSEPPNQESQPDEHKDSRQRAKLEERAAVFCRPGLLLICKGGDRGRMSGRVGGG